MKIHDWKIKIFSPAPLGGQIGELTPQDRITRNGLRMTLSPHGDCLDASWTGRNKELSSGRWIRHQDIIEIWTQDGPGDPFVARWSGYLVTVANQFATSAQEFKALGLGQKLKLRMSNNTYPEAIASSMAYSILSGASLNGEYSTPSGNFSGGLTIPDAYQNWQPDYEILQEVTAAGAIVWGIDAKREGFARPPSTEHMSVTEGSAGTTVVWEPASGVNFVSVVNFVWKDSSLGGDIYSQSITNIPLVAEYGVAERVIWLADDAYLLPLSTDDVALLEAWGMALTGTTTDTPTTATTAGLLTPEPTLEVTRPDSSVVSIPVEQVEYVISKAKNGITNIKAGRIQNPEEEIYQNLIRARDQAAENRSIRISKGV